MIRRFMNSPGRWLALPIFAVSLSLAGTGCEGEEPNEPDPTPEPAPAPEDDGGVPEDGGPQPEPGPEDGGPQPEPQPEDGGPQPEPEPEDGGPQPEPQPDPDYYDYVRVEGQVKRADYVENYYQADATVSMILQTPLIAAPSVVDTGAWYLDNVPGASNVQVTVEYDNGGVGAPAARKLQQKKYIPADDATYTFNPYVVPPSWLEQVATDCGTPLTPGNDGFPSPDLANRSTIVGTFKDLNGDPVAGITKADVSVELQSNGGAYINDNPAYICFLRSDGGTPAKYQGGDYPATDATGKFVIFRVTNAENNGSGAGLAKLSATYNGVQFENDILLSSGIAYLDAYAQEEVPIVDQLIDFEDQIIPILTNNQCNACHTVGGIGAVDRGGYLAVFDGTPSEIYDNIVGPGTVCEPGVTTYRVCGNYPDQSYLLSKPLIELDGGQNHPNYTWVSPDDPEVVTIRTWIQQGYPRYAVPPEPPPINATFADVMEYLGPSANGNGVNCTDCHGYNTGYSGGLSLDGCVDNVDIQTEYTAAGVDYDPVTNPDYYNEDCAYYHVALQTSAHYENGGDAYYVEGVNEYARVNLTYPNRSLLYRKPYCSPGRCVEYPLTHSGNPNIPTFYDETTPPAAAIIDWVTAGAYSRDNGPNPAP